MWLPTWWGNENGYWHSPLTLWNALVSVQLHMLGDFQSVQLGNAATTTVQDGSFALGKAHMCCTSSLRSFPNVAFETVLMLVGLMMVLTTHHFKEDCLVIPIFMSHSSRWSIV